MYHKLLNSLFGLVVKSERCWASCLANQYLSPHGVQNVLIKNMDKNEESRLAVFEGKLKEQIYEGDILKTAVARLEASYKSGQM
jgi:hypothetical protein